MFAKRYSGPKKGTRKKSILYGFCISVCTLWIIYQLYDIISTPPTKVDDTIIIGEPFFDPDAPWLRHTALFKEELMSNKNLTGSLSRLEFMAKAFNELPIRSPPGVPLKRFRAALLMLVHKRASYLSKTLELYANAPGSDQILFIISHDGLFPEVVDLVDRFQSLHIKELIFPYGYTWANDIYPGFCPESLPYKLGFSPGERGSLKLHFVWAMTRAFEMVGRPTRSHTLFDELIYMEDDYWITPDFFEAHQKLVDMREKTCPNICFGAVIGWHTFKLPQKFMGDDSATKARLWSPLMTSLTGLSISRKKWDFFHEKIHHYCNSHTRHWDDSIYLMMRRGCCGDPCEREVEPVMLFANFPRALHVGKCEGFHYKFQKRKFNCSIDNAFAEFKSELIDPLQKQYSIMNNASWEFDPLSPRMASRKLVTMRKLADKSKFYNKTVVRGIMFEHHPVLCNKYAKKDFVTVGFDAIRHDPVSCKRL